MISQSATILKGHTLRAHFLSVQFVDIEIQFPSRSFDFRAPVCNEAEECETLAWHSKHERRKASACRPSDGIDRSVGARL